jgi:hypothetical protein
MKQLLLNKHKMSYVDLYYNDLYGLQKSIRKITANIINLID